MLAKYERYPRPYAAIRSFGFRLGRLETPAEAEAKAKAKAPSPKHPAAGKRVSGGS